MAIKDPIIPGGRYRITREEHLALCRAVGDEGWNDDLAHPIFYFIATQVGMGLTVAQLCARCDFDIAQGPMMTRSDAAFSHDLKIDTDYDVSGEILSCIRKPSRTFGEVDLLTYRLRLDQSDGDMSVETTNQWILPRGRPQE